MIHEMSLTRMKTNHKQELLKLETILLEAEKKKMNRGEGHQKNSSFTPKHTIQDLGVMLIA